MKIPPLPALKIPPFVGQFSSYAATMGGKLAAHGSKVIRGLLVLSIMGGGMAAWGSLAGRAIQDQLPKYQKITTTWAAQIDATLTKKAAQLESLTNDPRLAEGLSTPDGVGSTPVRRAMYEYSYINQIESLLLWDNQTGQLGRTANGAPPSEEITGWLSSQTDSTRPHAALFNLKGAPKAFITHGIKDTPSAWLASSIEWNTFRTSLPGLPSLPGEGNNGGIRLSGDDGTWFISSRPSIAPKQEEEDPNPATTLTLTAPLNVLPGEAVIHIPLKNLTSDGNRPLQWGSVGLALVLMGIVLWPLVSPWFQKKVAAAKAKYQAQKAKEAEEKSGEKRTEEPTPPLPSPQATTGKRADIPPQAPLQASAPGRNLPQGGNLPSASASASKASPLGAAPQGGIQAPKPEDLAAPVRIRAAHMPSSPSKTEGTATTPTLTERTEEAHSRPQGNFPPPTQEKPKNEKPSLTKREIEEALAENRITLQYQPIYKAGDGSVTMHETYVRLIDKHGERIEPGQFFPVAAENKLIPLIDATVCRKVIAEHFPVSGLAPETPLALNLSGSSMEDMSYLHTITQLREERILKNLIFEVQSQELLQNPKLMKFLKEIQKNGIRLAVDYFGGGASMIEASKALGFNYIKINGARFMKDPLAKKELVVLCRAAHRLKLPVVLERIETGEMEAFARRVGVTYLQGYLFGHPTDTLTTRPLGERMAHKKPTVLPLDAHLTMAEEKPTDTPPEAPKEAPNTP